MVVHNSASRILIEGNRMWNNGRALSLGGVQIWSTPVSDVVIRRNLIFDHNTLLNGSGDGLRIGTSRRVRMYNNTLFNMPNSAIKVGDGSNGPAAETNVFNNVMIDTGRALEVTMTGTTSFKSDRNLAFDAATGTAQFRLNGTLMSLATWRSKTAQDATTVVKDPMFIDDPRTNDFFTKVGSPARDVGMATNGSVCFTGPDLGMLESCF
jgi:hypothetical protein